MVTNISALLAIPLPTLPRNPAIITGLQTIQRTVTSVAANLLKITKSLDAFPQIIGIADRVKTFFTQVHEVSNSVMALFTGNAAGAATTTTAQGQVIVVMQQLAVVTGIVDRITKAFQSLNVTLQTGSNYIQTMELKTLNITNQVATAIERVVTLAEEIAALPPLTTIKIVIETVGSVPDPNTPRRANGGWINGRALVGERGWEIADYRKTRYQTGWEPIGMFGPEVRMFPNHTRIIPHHAVKKFTPAIPSFASGGEFTLPPRLEASAGSPSISVTISGNTFGKTMDEKKLAKMVKEEIAKDLRKVIK